MRRSLALSLFVFTAMLSLGVSTGAAAAAGVTAAAGPSIAASGNPDVAGRAH